MTSTLAQTPLTAWHAAHGGRMVDFAGWSMPVQYRSIVEEHQATRSSVGLFDVSHMGRFRIAGPDGAKFLDAIVTRKVAGMKPGQIRYALVTDDNGGILDDVLVYRLAEPGGATGHDMVVNASNRQKIWDWLAEHQGPFDVDIADRTLDTAMLAVQGPRALEIVRPLVAGLDPSALRYYFGASATIAGTAGFVSRTGYTGEDGCELVVEADAALDLWENLVNAAAPLGGKPAGLGCRDTLRLEAAMPLYGHELTEKINPFQAGLAYAVDLDGRAFPGRDALLKLRDDKSLARRVGWELAGRRVPREGYAVLHQGRPVGHVTSGTFAPTLQRPIAMGYVDPEFTAPDIQVTIDIRGSQESARNVKLPFYRRHS
jgi:aminomethyltransferase